MIKGNAIARQLEILLAVVTLTFTTTGCGFKRTPDVEQAIQHAQDALELNSEYDLEEKDDNKELEKHYNKLKKIYDKALEDAKNSRTTENTEKIEYAYYALRTIIEADKSIDHSESIFAISNSGASELKEKSAHMMNLFKKACNNYVKSIEDFDRIQTSKISDLELQDVIGGAEGLHTEAKVKLLRAMNIIVERLGISEVDILKAMYEDGFSADKIRQMLNSFGMADMDIEYMLQVIGETKDGKPKPTFSNTENRFHRFFNDVYTSLTEGAQTIAETVIDAAEKLPNDIATKGWEIVATPNSEGGICSEEHQAIAREHLNNNQKSVQGREVE